MNGGVPATDYHERTKHTPRSVRSSGSRLNFDNKPRAYKVYENLESVSLGTPDGDREWMPALRAVSDPTVEAAADRPDLGTVAALCHYAAGVTNRLRRGDREIAFRAAATTGALYHVDLYVVCGDLRDLDAGVYHYDPREEALDVLRTGDYRRALARAAGDRTSVAGAPLSVVATSTWWRNAWKYEERTYRHAFWDSGTTLANLLAVCRALSYPAELVEGFADGSVADLVGVNSVASETQRADGAADSVDAAAEAPLSVVPVGAGDDPPQSPDVDPISPETRPLSKEERRFDLIEDAYAASALSDGESVAEWRRRAPDGDERVGVTDAGEGGRAALDPVGDERMAKTPLDVTVRRRGSCRAFARETLSFRTVSTVLDRAARGPPMDVRDPDGPALRFVDGYLVVHDVADLRSGAYQYHPDAGELELLESGTFRQEAGRIALDQSLAADAGACVVFMTDVDAVVDELGDRGYRVAQHEAAVAAGRLYLAAYAHRDLGATGLTFYDDEVTRFFAPRAADQTPMFFWVLGRPA